MRKILILNAGANYRPAYRTYHANYYDLPIQELAWRDLQGFDVIIVPAWSDQSLLSQHSKRLSEFIYKGGILVAFGCHSMQWFDYLEWNDGKNYKISITDEGKESGIFSNTNLDYVKWHSTLIAHGYFTCKNENTKVFVRDNQDRPVVVEIAFGKGLGLFMTLDPDFHFITGAFIDSESDKRKNAASSILWATMKWASNAFTDRHTYWAIYFRRLKGFISITTLFRIAYPILFLFIVIISIYVISVEKYSLGMSGILSIVLGTIGLLVAIAQEIRQRRISTNS